MSFITQAQEAIREAGGRITTQRELILQILDSVDELLDAESLYLLARERDTSLSLTTVYRTLNTLEEAGLIHQRYLTRDHERKVYETLHAEEEYHFTCRQCGRIVPFRSGFMEQLKHELETRLGVTNLTACVCVTGLCPDCQASKESLSHE
jgi:Fur family ferric uptake transcriptional regulator